MNLDFDAPIDGWIGSTARTDINAEVDNCATRTEVLAFAAPIRAIMLASIPVLTFAEGGFRCEARTLETGISLVGGIETGSMDADLDEDKDGPLTKG
jgi:hypothetical protein